MHQFNSRKSVSQQVLFPEQLELQAHEFLLFEQILIDLEFVGFEFEFVSGYTYLIKGIPSHLGSESVVDLLFGILKKASINIHGATLGLHEAISLSLSLSSCIKYGKHLSVEEIDDLIVRLFACDNHSFTPDGNKIMSIVDFNDIEKLFR
jgi:DNA mismatch repair protein MutL